jgi:uncharacterized protein YqiB (DUF1249 family)
MFADSLIVPECIFRPGSFTGLMTIYESNYIRLLNLGDDLRTILTPDNGERISTTSRDCDLYLKLLRQERYTTTANLTYWFEDESDRVADPDLVLRVYHDAHLVEAVSGTQEHCHPELREFAKAHSSELDRRWRNNIMLNKWLDYLVDMGHGFS